MIMTDYEYILQQAKKFHYSKWSDEELRKCVEFPAELTWAVDPLLHYVKDYEPKQ